MGTPALAEHATGEVLANLQDFLRRNAAEGVALRGTYEFDARATSVSDDRASVADCRLDQTQLVVMATGDVAEPLDQERDGVVAGLVLEEGTWKVTTVRDDPRSASDPPPRSRAEAPPPDGRPGRHPNPPAALDCRGGAPGR